MMIKDTPIDNFDHQFQTRYGVLIEIGYDEGPGDEGPNLIGVFSFDGDPKDEDHYYYYRVDCWDPAVEAGDRVEVTTGKSQTTRDGNYCEVGPPKRCFGCDKELTPETTHIGEASITGNDDLENQDEMVLFCTECHPKEGK